MVSFILMILLFSAVNCTSQPYLGNDTESSGASPGVPLEGSTISPNATINTHSLATNLSTVDYRVTNLPGSFEGYTLFNLHETNTLNNTLVIIDMNGNIVAQKNIGTTGGYNCPAEFINPNTILTGSHLGAALWFLNNDTLKPLGFLSHHEYEYNPNNNTVFTLIYHSIDIDGTGYRFDYIRERTMNGTLVWEMDVHDFISENWWCPAHDMAGFLFTSPKRTG